MCHEVPEGYHNGASVIDLDITANNAELSMLVWMSIVVIVAVQVVLWLLFNFILKKFVSDPAGRMRTAIMEISSTGDFTRRVKVDSDDEIGQTAHSFNDLMGNLQTAFRQVHEDISKGDGVIALAV